MSQTNLPAVIILLFCSMPFVAACSQEPRSTPADALRGDAARIGEDLAFSLDLIVEEKEPAVAVVLIHNAIIRLSQRTDIRKSLKVLRYRLEAGGSSKEAKRTQDLEDKLYNEMLANTSKLGKAIERLDKPTAKRLNDKMLTATL